MSPRKTCFVKLDDAGSWLWNFTILPVLNECNYIIKTIADAQTQYESIFDYTVNLIKDSDLIIMKIDNFNANNCYELGLAHAWGKPTIVFSKAIDNLPANIAKMPLIYTDFAEYSGSESSDKLRKLLYAKIGVIEKERGLIDRTTERYSSISKLVSIHLDARKSDPVISFKYVSELLSYFESLIGHRGFKLIEMQSNSFKSIVELNIKDIAILIEKIIFFFHESRKKNAEVARINAETRRIDTETLIKLLKSHKELGYKRIMFGNKIVIDCTEEGEIIIHDYGSIVGS